MDRRLGPLPPHGTRARYQRGCTCPDCRLENTVYQRGYRVRTHAYGPVRAGRAPTHRDPRLEPIR